MLLIGASWHAQATEELYPPLCCTRIQFRVTEYRRSPETYGSRPGLLGKSVAKTQAGATKSIRRHPTKVTTSLEAHSGLIRHRTSTIAPSPVPMHDHHFSTCDIPAWFRVLLKLPKTACIPPTSLRPRLAHGTHIRQNQGLKRDGSLASRTLPCFNKRYKMEHLSHLNSFLPYTTNTSLTIPRKTKQTASHRLPPICRMLHLVTRTSLVTWNGTWGHTHPRAR